jgi:hypothetical protein
VAHHGVRRGTGVLVGDNIYNTTGTGQARSGAAARPEPFGEAGVVLDRGVVRDAVAPRWFPPSAT